jgi:hypothetical protein
MTRACNMGTCQHGDALQALTAGQASRPDAPYPRFRAVRPIAKTVLPAAPKELPNAQSTKSFLPLRALILARTMRSATDPLPLERGGGCRLAIAPAPAADATGATRVSLHLASTLHGVCPRREPRLLDTHIAHRYDSKMKLGWMLRIAIWVPLLPDDRRGGWLRDWAVGVAPVHVQGLR